MPIVAPTEPRPLRQAPQNVADTAGTEAFLPAESELQFSRARGVALVLVEPDMAANVGAILRLGACLGVPVHVVEPCGFAFSAEAWRRTALDYARLAEIHRHASWTVFAAGGPPGRRVALSARADASLWSFAFAPGDLLLMGCESAGLPADVAAAADARLRIPLAAGARSLNIGMAAAIAAAEAHRQLGRIPGVPE